MAARVVGRLVRMRADRAPDIVIASAIARTPELVEPGADRQHRPDPGGARAGDHRIALGGEIREIEMAMAVDQHRESPSPAHSRRASTKRGKIPRRRRQAMPRGGSGVGQSREAPASRGHAELVEQPRPRSARRAASGSPDAARPRPACRAPSHARRSLRAAAPRAPARRHSGWPRRRPARSSPAPGGSACSAISGRTRPSRPRASQQPLDRRRRSAPGSGTRAAAIAVDHRQHALRQIAEIVGEIAVEPADHRRDARNRRHCRTATRAA